MTDMTTKGPYIELNVIFNVYMSILSLKHRCFPVRLTKIKYVIIFKKVFAELCFFLLLPVKVEKKLIITLIEGLEKISTSFG